MSILMELILIAIIAATITTLACLVVGERYEEQSERNEP